MYKLIKNPISKEIKIVLRLFDNAFIPFDEANTDYQEYLKWTKESPMNVAAQPEEADKV